MVPKTALLNLRHLRVFLEVAKSGGISAAARTVNLSQPAITQAIAKLEAVFQQKLFARGSTGMFLTEAGALLQARADRALAHIRNGCGRSRARCGTETARQVHSNCSLPAPSCVRSCWSRHQGVFRSQPGTLASLSHRFIGLPETWRPTQACNCSTKPGRVSP